MGIRLRNGDRICIVGGGPAGSLAAMQLLKLAEEYGLDLDVLVFEPHDACTPGPRGCKGCAGILSADTVHNLQSLGLEVPPEVVQSELRSYVVHVQPALPAGTGGQVTSIDQPNPARRILSVFRGAGPRLQRTGSVAGFDGYLLAQAVNRGRGSYESAFTAWPGRASLWCTPTAPPTRPIS